MTMEIVGNDAQFNEKVTLLKDLEIYGNIKNKTKDTSFDFSNDLSFKIQGNEKLRITSDGATGDISAHTLNVVGVSTFNDDVVFKGAAYNMRWDHSTNDLILFDNTRLEFGSNKDFEIWHGGSHTFMKNSGGDLRIRGDKILLKREDGTERYLEANVNSEVKLFFNGDEKFETTSSGVSIGGTTIITSASGGRLGISQSNPQALLSLGAGVDAQKLLLYDNVDTNKYGFGIQNNELRQFYPDNSRMVIGTIAVSDGSTFSEKLRITSSGLVGINENPITAQFEVKSAQLGGTTGDTQEVVRLHTPDVTNTTSYRFTNYRVSDGTTNLSSELRFRRHVDASDQGYFGLGFGYASIGYATAEKLRISNVGAIGIGGANYGTSGQVLTSQGSASAVQWTSTAAKAFVNFAGTTNVGGNCVIRDDHNVSSVTDNGTGNYTVNFDVAFSNTNYTVTVGHSNTPNNGSTHGVLYLNTFANGSVQVMNFADDSGGNLVDKDVVSVVVHAT